jgi:nucleotide-binding universal stress UspA family protein
MQFNRVIVAVDFSAASLAAARWVAMQLAPRAEVVLAHVVGEPSAPPFLRPHLAPLTASVAELSPALNGALRGLAGVVGGARTSVKLLTGTPADALAAFAREIGADLICLGRRRRRRGGARFGHTTAQRLLEQTGTPVLVVPAARPMLPARILAPIDDHPGSSTDLRGALELADTYEAAVEVLHVLAPELCLNGKARLESLTHEWLASQVQQVDDGARRVTSHVRVGDPGEQIVKFVRAAAVDLVTIGRGREEAIADVMASGTHAFPLGSTSRLVLWASPCPVLVQPPAAQPAEPEAPSPPPLTLSRQRSSTVSHHSKDTRPWVA